MTCSESFNCRIKYCFITSDDVCVLSASGTAAIAVTTIGLKNVELLTVSTKQMTTNPVIADAPCPGRGVEKDRSVMVKMDSLMNTATMAGNVGPYAVNLFPTIEIDIRICNMLCKVW